MGVLERDRRFSSSLTQSASLRAASPFSFLLNKYRRAGFRAALRYQSTYFNAFQSLGVGSEWNFPNMDTAAETSGLVLSYRKPGLFGSRGKGL